MRKRLDSSTYKVMAHLSASVECCPLYLKECIGEVGGFWRGEMEFIKKRNWRTYHVKTQGLFP